MRSKSSLMTNSLCIQTAGFLWNKCHFLFIFILSISAYLLHFNQHKLMFLCHSPYTYQGQLSFGLSLLYCWCTPHSNCHSSAAGGHTFYTSSRSFPWNQYTIHYMHFKPILSQTKMCVKHSLPNYEKITLTFDLKDDLDSILTLNFHYIIKSFCTVAQ